MARLPDKSFPAAKDAATREVFQSDATLHEWSAIYRWPIGMAAVILILFGLLFNDKTAVGRDEAPASAAA